MTKLYGNNLVKFTKIRNQLDPNHIFTNNYVNRLLD